MICKLKNLMEAKGVNQSQLAKATGLAPSTVGRMYRNTLTRLEVVTLEKLKEYFELTSISELIDF
jgi:transcriptional regulator with XRE-family HTH domain